MERWNVYCRDVCCGEGYMVREKGRAEINVTMDDPKDGLYRATLVGDAGQLPLGVMEPQNGQLTLRRRPYLRDIEQLGTLHSIRAVCSFPFRKQAVWQQTAQPATLVESTFLRQRLAPFSCAWWHKEQGRLSLALPLETGKPFPLETFFCFGRVTEVNHCRCVLYVFDENDRPL